MLKQTRLWAVDFMRHLTAGLLASQGGFSVVNPDTGNPEFVPPNRSAMWPPHRPHPTPKKFKKGYRAKARTINEAMKRGGAPVHVLNPTKYLHGSRTSR